MTVGVWPTLKVSTSLVCASGFWSTGFGFVIWLESAISANSKTSRTANDVIGRALRFVETNLFVDLDFLFIGARAMESRFRSREKKTTLGFLGIGAHYKCYRVSCQRAVLLLACTLGIPVD